MGNMNIKSIIKYVKNNKNFQMNCHLGYFLSLDEAPIARKTWSSYLPWKYLNNEEKRELFDKYDAPSPNGEGTGL